MSSIPEVKSLRIEDYSNDDQKENFKTLIPVLSRFMTSIVDGLNNSLTFTENIRAELRDFTLDPSAVPFRFTLNNKNINANGVMIIKSLVNASSSYNASDLAGAPGCMWYQDGNQIVIQSFYGLKSGTTYNIKVMVV